MSDNDLRKPRGSYSIFCNNHYIVAIGKGIYVFDISGKLLWSRVDLKYIYKLAFLSEDTIIADCGSLGLYIVFSLLDGSFLKQIKIPKCDYTGFKFAISSDGRYVYDLYYRTSRDIDCYVVKLDLQEISIDHFLLDIGLRATHDIICDENDTLCILQTQNEMIGNKEIELFGIRYESCDIVFGHGSAYYWKDKWYFELPRNAQLFIENVNQILTNDFHIYNPLDKSLSNLLENETCSWPEGHMVRKCRLDGTKQYLQLIYQNCDIIIDILNKKLVARYITESEGCLIGNEYWVSSDEGIIRKPFPSIEL